MRDHLTANPMFQFPQEKVEELARKLEALN